ncbi:hypothetical protein WOLCODRAFT_164196 [Wolfiporia cocos MD-104 SS10]|uniref:Uncharacterized protein n=1 Tax=Wolfiporia cocos (strain MD-104) TaxID=742152 RepID=A0A2H3K1Y2_WOLCO|nr:hypothetical protein WOLCODRAFT_164196 [Wolfiporia cocos MD-104 SS10]
MSRDLLRTTFGAFNAIDFLYNNLSYSRSILYNEAQLHKSLRIEGPSLPPLSPPIFDVGFDFEDEYFGGESTLVDQSSPSVSTLKSDDPVLRASERTDDSEAATSSPSTPNSPSGIHDENIDVALDPLSENVLSVSPVPQAIIGRPTMSSFGDSVPRSGSVLPSSNSEGCILGKRTRTQADLGDIEAIINGGNSTAVNDSTAISKAHFTDKHLPMSMLSIGTRDGVDDTSEGNASDAHDNLGQSSSLVAPASPHRCVASSTGDANARITSCLASTSPTLVAHDAGTCSSPDTMMDDDDLVNGQDTPHHATSSVSGPVQPAPVLPIRGNTGSRITTEAELRPSDTVFACLYEDCRFEGMSHQHLHLDVLGHTGVEAPR